MKLLSAFFILTMIVNFGFSQNPTPVYLWPDKVPGETEAKHDPVQSPKKEGDVIRLTDITNPAYFVYMPAPGKNNGAGVIICPGGGYNILAYDKEGTEVAKWLNGQGITAFVLQYRVPKKQEGSFDGHTKGNPGH